MDILIFSVFPNESQNVFRDFWFKTMNKIPFLSQKNCDSHWSTDWTFYVLPQQLFEKKKSPYITVWSVVESVLLYGLFAVACVIFDTLTVPEVKNGRALCCRAVTTAPTFGVTGHWSIDRLIENSELWFCSREHVLFSFYSILDVKSILST